MSRLVGHGRSRREGGFSFVELLVTIIIAGIAFAAMVPLFVSAQQVTAADQLRNAALQLAQDKLEKIRALDYDLITEANLSDPDFMGGQFGTSVQWATGGGNTRTFTVAYKVDLLPEGSQNGKELYKQVTVTASWTAPPAPVKPAVLSTMVSKQYAGPRIVRFEVGPDSVLEYDATTGASTIVSGPVVLDAYIAPEDIQSMNQSASESSRGYVLFTVTAQNGQTVVASGKVTQPVSPGEPAHYQFVWDNSGVSDGLYVFEAVAVAGFGSRAQGVPVSVGILYSNHAPPAPTSLEVTAVGDGVVYLHWVAPAAGDIAGYEVWRSEDGVTFAKVADLAGAEKTDYADTGLTNEVTYYYKVRATDTEGLHSPFTPTVAATPEPPGDTKPPSVPAGLTAAKVPEQPSITLTWTASTDEGNPPTGVAGYTVERSADGVNWSTLVALYPGTTYTDATAGYAKTWYYRVRAVDGVGNVSGWAGPVAATTDPQPKRTITVYNNSSSAVYVWVYDPAANLWYTTTGVASSVRPATGTQIKKNKSARWTNLPPAGYNVYFLSTSTWDAASIILKTQHVDVTAGDGTATYP